MSYIDIRLLHKFNIMRTTYNKLNNHALVFIEITKAWLFFIIIITKLANKAYLLGIKSRLFFITYPTQRHMAIPTASAKPAINCKSINTPPHL